MRLHRLLGAMPLAALLLAPAAAFAGGEADTGAAAGAMEMETERTTFDHEWDDLRYYNHVADYTAATGNTITSFGEAPMLAEMVAAGDLPPVEERLPDDPYVVVPYQEIGQYGGYAFMGRDGTGHWGDAHLLIGIEQLNRIAGDLSTQAPNVATGHELSADARVLTVKLREGIKWSTGEPFTTADIRFWYEDIILNEELTPNPARFLQPGGELMKMNFLDDHTFQFAFAVPYPVVVEWLPHPNRGVTPIKHAKHYFSQFHPTYVGAEKAEALAKEAGFENWVQHFSDLNNSWSELPKFNTERPMLTAYRLAEIGTDLARWERNPYYWKIDVEGNQLPYMDGINVELLQDLQVFAGKIIAGEMTISIGWYAPLSDYPLLKQNEEAGGYTVELWPSLEGSATLFQANRTVDDPALLPIFSDSRFSHALSLALDRDEINEVVFQGLGTPRQHTLIKESIYFEPRFAEAYAEHDLARANQLLDELGLTWDANREWRLLPDGNRFSVVMDTGSAVLAIHELAVEQWKEIGMEVTMKSFSYQQSQERSTTNQMQLYGGSAGFNARSEAFAASPLFFLPQRQGWENPWGNQWALWYVTGGEGGIEPPAEVKRNLDRWERMTATLDLDEKIGLGKEILASQADNLWVIGTVGEVPLPMPRSNKLRNFPERGGHDWSIGSWTGPQHPSQFYLAQE